MRETDVEPHFPSSVVTRSMDNPRTSKLPPSSGVTNPPPLASGKRQHANGRNERTRGSSEVLDPIALNQALRDFDEAGRSKEKTPTGSPSRKRQRVYGDRFIPNREGQDLHASFSLLHDDASPASPTKTKKRTPHGELHFQRSK